VTLESAVDKATGYELDGVGVGVRVPVGWIIFPNSRPVLDPIQAPLIGTGSHSRGVKRPGCEANRSPPISAEVKKTRICICTPPYAFMA
jgi:hypothetical protein